MIWWRRAQLHAAVIGVIALALAVVATRHGPRLSPDSITYLSAAEHLRHGRGLTDFTGEPFTVFPPVLPVVLAPFGAQLWWACAVNVVAFVAIAVLLHRLLVQRVRPGVADVAVLAVVVCQGTVTVVGSMFSEPLYVVVSLAAVLALGDGLLGDGSPSVRRALAVGALAGFGFLVRYAGVALIGAVLFAALAVWWQQRAGTRRAWLPLMAMAGSASAIAGAWLLRNSVVAGQPMGPRWSGGTTESWRVLVWRPFESIGTIFVGDARVASRVAGVLAVAVLLAGSTLVVRRRPWRATDVAMISLGWFSLAVPVLARAVTASDISARVVWPVVPALASAAAITMDAAITSIRSGGSVARSVARRLSLGVAAVILAAGLVWSTGQGVRTAIEWAGLPGSGDREVFSAGLHDAIDGLPAGTTVVTNNPWGVWWQHRTEPTLMAFVRPRSGNSHVPIGAGELLGRVCDGPVALAWFSNLQNAGDGPVERRPDLLQVVELRSLLEVPNGELFSVVPIDVTACDDQRTMTAS